MKLILASDHRGYNLKESLKQNFPAAIDAGALSLNPDDDYVDYAKTAIEQMNPEDKTILICGSGHGMSIAANRYPHIRAILGFNETVVKQGREHEDANVLVIPSDWTTEENARHLVDIFLNTPFSNEERHKRRIKKL